MAPRTVKRMYPGRRVTEGAGVRLRRMVGMPDLELVDPFLLLDEFKSDNPDDYIAGFPWHPHRGIETVTYMIHGQVQHGDSMGRQGVIGPGDVQWMTAGHGIIHEEMPRQQDGLLWGFQLWVNLPARLKLCDPRYQEVSAARIPTVTRPCGVTVKVIAGEYGGTQGAVREIAVDPLYLDLALPEGATIELPLPPGHAALCHVFHGQGLVAGTQLDSPMLAVLGDGDLLHLTAGGGGLRCLLAAGRPLHEPVARGGPFVMNTREEIEQAFLDYQRGTLIKR